MKRSFTRLRRRQALLPAVVLACLLGGCAAPSSGPATEPLTGAGAGKAETPVTAVPPQVQGKSESDTAKAPVPEGNPFRFVVMGDSRGSSNGTNEKIVRSLLEQVKALSPVPAFLLFTGDQVSGGSDVGGQLASWKNIVDDYFPMTSVFPALGNHEHNEKIFTESFPSLPKEQLPGYGKTVYSFDHENARFITLNSDRRGDSKAYAIDAEQRAWLEKQLQTSGTRHVFVQFHIPAYPNGAHLGDSLDRDPVSRDALWALLDRYKVTAVFVGHEHNYNRRKVDSAFDGNGYHFENTIYQLTIGGAGAPLYSAGKEMKQVVAGPKSSYHYTVVDVNGGKAVFKTYDLQSNEIDAFTVER